MAYSQLIVREHYGSHFGCRLQPVGHYVKVGGKVEVGQCSELARLRRTELHDIVANYVKTYLIFEIFWICHGGGYIFLNCKITKKLSELVHQQKLTSGVGQALSHGCDKQILGSYCYYWTKN
jgi:hypothetical protein